MLTASFRSPAPLCYCSMAINHGRRWNSGLVPTRGSPGCRNRDVASLLLPNSLGSRRAQRLSERSTPTHPVGAPQLSQFKALLRFHPLCSLPPALDYSIRDYAFASYLQANWGLCQGQHKFQPVSLITVRPTHWKL